MGEILSRKLYGQGTRTYTNGNKYEGDWKDGRPNGQGIDIFLHGIKRIAEFRDGGPWNIIHRDKNGNITGKYVNGEWIKQ